MDPLVEIVILNWNGHADTLRCIASLRRQTYPNARIVVVDNGSTEDPPDAFAGLDPGVRLVRLPENLGYTGGNNAAMRAAFGGGAAYVWLFNNDATADPDALAVMVAACEADPRIGLASPIVLEEGDPSIVQLGCGLFDPATHIYTPSYDRAQSAEWQRRFPDRIALHGTALLVRRELYEAIGGFDDVFFAYWEDIDYSMRSAQAGFRNAALLDTAIHHGSKPTMTEPALVKPHYYYFVSRNELLMWRKFCAPAQFVKVALWILQRQLRQIARMPGNAAGVEAVLAGLWHGLLRRGGPYDPARRIPGPLRWLLGRHPMVWVRLLGGKPNA
jgi:GT2 family glycosyltransferase